MLVVRGLRQTLGKWVIADGRIVDSNKAGNAERVTKGPAEPRCRGARGPVLFSRALAVWSRINAARYNGPLSPTAV